MRLSFFNNNFLSSLANSSAVVAIVLMPAVNANTLNAQTSFPDAIATELPSDSSLRISTELKTNIKILSGFLTIDVFAKKQKEPPPPVPTRSGGSR
ncbi:MULTISPECIES: hypothetical protein [Aerosakkonema]|uniref:hypothetical protein n=1 Tax=Aerosakkonema TaxID=1246629 RepID=UPI0035BA3D28